MMQSNKPIIFGPNELEHVVDVFYRMREMIQVFTFTGDLGAGKTTLIKALCKRWGITQGVTSPTFSYVHIYHINNNQSVYHFDLYRLTSLDEFFEMGFDEFLYLPHSWAFVEWPAVIKPLLTHNVCHITLDYKDDKRIMTYSLAV